MRRQLVEWLGSAIVGGIVVALVQAGALWRADAQAKPATETFEARKMVIRDEAGAARIVMSAHKDGGAFLGFVGPDGRSNLSLVQAADGTPVVKLHQGEGGIMLTTGTDDITTIELSAADGRRRVIMRADRETGAVEVIGVDGKTLDELPRRVRAEGRPS